MSGEIEVAVTVKSQRSVNAYDTYWPGYVAAEQQDTGKELRFMLTPDGIKITRGQFDHTYYITFMRYEYGLYQWLPNVTRRFPITFDQIFSMRNFDRKQILLQFSSYFTTHQLGKRCKWHEFGDYGNFSLEHIYRSGVKSARIRVLALIYYAIFRDLEKLKLRGFTWLCISTIHFKSLPKDVRKLICDLI